MFERLAFGLRGTGVETDAKIADVVDSLVRLRGADLPPKADETWQPPAVRVNTHLLAPLAAELGYDEAYIATSIGEIEQETRAYVGPLVPGILTAIAKNDVRDLFTRPDHRIPIWDLEIGGSDKKKLKARLGRQASGLALQMINNRAFKTGRVQTVTLVKPSVRDLDPRYEQEHLTWVAYTECRAKLGSFECPAEVGPYQRFHDTAQPKGTYYLIDMDPISVAGGDPRVFKLGSLGSALELYGHWLRPGDQLNPGDGVVSVLRKQT